MAEFSFLEEKDGPKPYDADQVDSFLDVLQTQGIVTPAQGSLLEAQTIKLGGDTSNETIDGFEVQYGVVFSDFVFNVSPARNAIHTSRRMAQNRKQVILAIVKTLSPVIPFSVQVDIIEPASDWDLQLWTVKVRNIFDTLELHIENVQEKRYELVANLRLAAAGQFK